MLYKNPNRRRKPSFEKVTNLFESRSTSVKSSLDGTRTSPNSSKAVRTPSTSQGAASKSHKNDNRVILSVRDCQAQLHGFTVTVI